MLIIALIIISIILLYTVLIIRYSVGWRNVDGVSENSFTPKVSVVIAMRNEEDEIARLLANLESLIYPKENLEIILINDHSDDDTLNLLRAADLDNLQVFDMPEHKFGKKNAISMGVDIARGDIILTTDADCSFDENWVRSMVSCFIDYNIKLVSGPVCFNKTKGIFQYFQSLEFASLVGSGAGAIGIKNPIFCNGANMAYRRQDFLDVNDSINNHIASGDDVFLLHSIKARYSDSIAFLKKQDAIVSTNSMENFLEFINQRKRWISKTNTYQDVASVYTAYLVFFTNLSFIFLFIMSFFSSHFFVFFGLFYFIKLIVDFSLLSPVLNFFGRKDLIKWIVIFELIYSFYIILIVILSLIKKFEWKGRMYKR